MPLPSNGGSLGWIVLQFWWFGGLLLAADSARILLQPLGSPHPLLPFMLGGPFPKVCWSYQDRRKAVREHPLWVAEMRRFEALRRSFPFLARFRMYTVRERCAQTRLQRGNALLPLPFGVGLPLLFFMRARSLAGLLEPTL